MSHPIESSRRRVLVTGASRGIGRATALALARRGERVVLCARSREGLEAVAREAGERAEIAVLDVTDDESVARALGEILARGPVDVLVNNAGVYEQQLFLAQDPAWQRREMEVNYFGALRVTRAVLPSMLTRGRGTIVNVSSLIGAIPCPATASYCASKAALNAWTHALRGEFSHRGVRTVVFMPSHTATEAARLDKALEKLGKDLAGLDGRLNNPRFLASAGEDVVEETRSQRAEKADEAARIEAALKLLRAMG